MSGSNIIVLSAGGTGGHLFPAQALASELARRGRDIVVMTDARFANYATQFPRARIETVPSSPLNVSVTVPLPGKRISVARYWSPKAWRPIT